MSLALSSVALTDLGLRRPNNEDTAFAGRRLLVVADGIGGAPAGDWASQLVVDVFTPLEQRPPGADPGETLRATLADANAALRAGTAAEPHRQGAGTTLTAVLLHGEKLALIHVGDSRAYRLREARLEQLTRDDTFVALLVDRGVLTPEQAEHHPQRSVVVQAVQGGTVTPTVLALDPRPGDRLLLCSDGLSDVVARETIEATLTGRPELAECAAELIRMAMAAGGPDNVTVIVADLFAE